MPVYHFNLIVGVTRVLDPRGIYLPDDDAARWHAIQLARNLNGSVEVIAENGDCVDTFEP
jgi:Domain of unknown function (DUF6894)